MKRWMVGALAASACVVGCGGASAPPASAASPLLDKPLPTFSRKDLGGEKVDIAALKGKVVVVKFFAKYCEPCKRTLPAAEKLHHARPDVAFVGIDEDDSEGKAREVVSQFGLTFPVVHDASNVLSGRFRVSDLPVVFVADREGNVRWIGGPEQGEDELGRAVEALAR
jgi:thiol-disulfide isomerase/thioredoxin